MPDEADLFLEKWGKPKAAPDEADAFLAKYGGTPKRDTSTVDAAVLAMGKPQSDPDYDKLVAETVPLKAPQRTYARPEDVGVAGVQDVFDIQAPRTPEERAASLTDPYVEKRDKEIAAQAWVQRNKYALSNIMAGEALWGNRMNLDYFRKENGDLDPERAYKFYDDIYKRHRKTFTTTQAITARALDTFAKTATLGLWSAFGPMTAEDRAALTNTPGVGGAADIAAQTGAGLAGSMAPMSALSLVPRAEATLIASGMNEARARVVAPVLTNMFQGGATAFGERGDVGDALKGAIEGGAFAAGAGPIARRIAPMGSSRPRMAVGEGAGFALTGEAIALLQGEGIDPARFAANFGAGAVMGAAGGSPLRKGEKVAAESQRMNDSYAKARGMEDALTGGEPPGPIVPPPDFVQRVRPEDVPIPVSRLDMETARAEGAARREAAKADRGPDDAPITPGEPSGTPLGGGAPQTAPVGVPGTKAPKAEPDTPVDPLLPRGALPEAGPAELELWLKAADSPPMEAPPAADRPLGGAEVGQAPTGVPGTKGAVSKAKPPESVGYLHPRTPAEAKSQQASLLADAQAKLGGKPSKAKMGKEAGATTPGALAATVLNPRRLLGAVQEGQKYVMRKVGEGVSTILDLPRFAAAISGTTDRFLATRAYRERVAGSIAEESLARFDAEDVMRSIRVPKGADPELGFRYLTGDATKADVDAAYGTGWADRADVFRRLRTDNSTELEALDRDLAQLGVIERGDLLSPEAQAKYAGGEKYLVRQYEKILRDDADNPGGFAAGGRRMPARHRREDVSLERRMELGEIRDPAVVMAATLAKQNVLLARARMLRDVMNNPRYSKPKEWDATDPDNPKLMDPGAGWVESQYSGKRWVRDYFAKDLEGTFGTKTGADKAARFIDGLTTTWKWIVSGGRPAALGRDVASNFTMFAEMANQSILDPMNSYGSVRGASILIAKPGSPEWAVKRELVKAGLMGSSSFEPDMLKMLDDVRASNGDDTHGKFLGYLGKKLDAFKRGDVLHAVPGAEVVAKPMEWIAKFKQMQDSFIRARSVALRMEQGDSLPEAIKFAQDYYPHYGANVANRMKGGGIYGAAARALVQPPFLNFMEWSMRYWVKQILTQPLTVYGMFQGLKALTSYTQAANGVTDEQMADADAVLQPHERPGMLRPMVGWDHATQSPRSMDLSLMIPFGNEAEGFMRLISGEGDEGESSRFLPTSPFGSIIIQRATNKSWLTGRTIANPADPKSKQDEDLWKFTKYALFPMARDYDKFMNAVNQVPIDARGKHKPNLLISALDAFFGIKARTPDVENARWYGLQHVASTIDEKIARLEKIMNDERIPKDQRLALKDEIGAEIVDIYEKSVALRLREDRGVMPKVPTSAGEPALRAAKDVAGDMARKAKAAAGGFGIPKGR